MWKNRCRKVYKKIVETEILKKSSKIIKIILDEKILIAYNGYDVLTYFYD
jgi:hypothetical protein